METIKQHTNTKENQKAHQASGSIAVIDALLSENVDTIFGYPGGAIMPIYSYNFV